MIITGHPRKAKAIESAYAATKEINEKKTKEREQKKKKDASAA